MKRLLSVFFCLLIALVLVVQISDTPVQAASITTRVDGLVLDDPANYKTEYAYVNASNAKIVDFLDLEGKPDWLKVLLIYDLVCDFVEYDSEGETRFQSEFKTLTTGYTKCSGYAWLLADLLREAGLTCRYVSCDVLDHAWNIVKLDGKWYNLDATWDDPGLYGKMDYRNFLRCDASFGHARNGLDPEEFSGYDGIRISDTDYLCGHFAEDLYWRLSEDFTLTMYGSGKVIDGYCGSASKIKHAIISDGITTLGNSYSSNISAFAYCGAMTDITIPTSVTTIVEYSFNDCYALTDVYYAGSEEQWNQISIGKGNDDLLDARIHFAVEGDLWESPSGVCGDNLTWTLSKDYKLYIKGTGPMYNYTEGTAPWLAYADHIYDVVVENGATTIGNYAFNGCRRMMTITLPDTVKTIGEYAFYNCVGMRSFTFLHSITSVGVSAFEGCTKLRTVQLTGNLAHLPDRLFYGCSRLLYLEFPEGLMSIGDYCFYDCSGFSANGLPNSLRAIGKYAFAGCTVLSEPLTSPNIPVIEEGTFYGCMGFGNVTLPSHITYIGPKAFSNCDWLETFTFSGAAVSVSDSAFAGCGYLKNVDLNGVTSIGNKAFLACGRISDIQIPNTVTSIGDEAFSSCSDLESVTIPASVTTFGENIFKQCNRLTTATFQEGITQLGVKLFSYCTNLTTVNLPDSLLVIPDNAFESCWALQNVTLPKNLETIGTGAFYGTALKSVTIPGTVRSLGAGAFAASELETLVLEDGMVNLGTNAFGSCYDLKNVTLPVTLTTIDASAFSGCSALRSITIPAGVTTIGNYAFSNCGLNTVYYCGNSSNWQRISKGVYNTALNNVQYIEGYDGICNTDLSTFWYLSTDGQLTIFGNGVANVHGWGAYADQIKSLWVLDGITAVEGQIFYNLNNLETVHLPQTLTRIDSFGSCEKLRSITLPHSVTALNDFLFLGCSNLQEINLPKNITSIPAGAFGYCSALTSITLPDSVVTIGENAFDGCSSLKTIVLPAGVTSIGDGVFANCTALTSVTLPSKITAIGNSVFNNCSKLATLVVPKGVTTIGQWAFNNCNQLTDIVLPGSLSSVGANAFPWGVVTDVYYAGNASQWESISIDSSNYGLTNATMHYNHAQHTLATREENKVAATCTADGGYDLVTYCTDCNQVQHKQHVVLKTQGHSYTIWTTLFFPDCTTQGTERRDCIYCDHYEENTLPTLGHTESRWMVKNNLAATCTLDGLYELHTYCTVCREELSLRSEPRPALGHQYHSFTVPPTTTEDGYSTHLCMTCGHYYEDNFVSRLPSITKNLKSVTVDSGATATVSLKATGKGLRYKWYYKNKGDKKFTLTKSFTGNSYSITMTAARAGRQVYCVVTDKLGRSVTSKTVTLDKVTFAKILKQPASVLVKSGATAKVTVSAEGNGLTYKWYYKNKGDKKFTLTKSFTGSSYSITMTAARAGRQVYCVITDKYGNSVTSATVTLKLKTEAKVTTAPKSLSVKKGTTAKFTVKAVGDGLTYRWQVKTPSGSWKYTKTTGYKTATIKVSATKARNGYRYRCVVTDKYGNKAYSASAKLTVK